jgi:RNA polymerase sigma-70 factor (ECF subfamily)
MTTEPTPSSSRPRLDPEQWVERHCDALYRFAVARVPTRETAQDLVQETFLAAWRSASGFEGGATERTWLMRIMRNKLVDYYRKQRPEVAVGEVEELAAVGARAFRSSGLLHAGAWNLSVAPKPWGDAVQCLEMAEFWEVVRQCANQLPPKAGHVFLMRELDGQSTEEICSALRMSPNHVGVLLHRARLALRRCLELRWFKNETGQSLS